MEEEKVIISLREFNKLKEMEKAYLNKYSELRAIVLKELQDKQNERVNNYINYITNQLELEEASTAHFNKKANALQTELTELKGRNLFKRIFNID